MRPFLVLAALLSIAGSPTSVRSVCELSSDFSRFRNQVVTVRGVYYYGLRQQCPQKCAVGLWPSFINLVGGEDTAWNALAKTEKEVEAKAQGSGKRFEIWVTVVGRLEAPAKRSPLGPCDRIAWGNYGHLGGYPAQLAVSAFRDIEVKVNPRSPYDYGKMYHGPA